MLQLELLCDLAAIFRQLMRCLIKVNTLLSLLLCYDVNKSLKGVKKFIK